MGSSEPIKQVIDGTASRLGVSLTLEPLIDEDYDFEIRLQNYPRPSGFGIFLRHDYLSWSIKVKFDSMSRALLAEMRKTAISGLTPFESLVSRTTQNVESLRLAINGIEPEAAMNDEEWLNFDMNARISYRSVNDPIKVLEGSMSGLLGIPLSLLISQDWTNDSSLQGKEEGARSVVKVTKYERNRFNRALCLDHHGFSCQGCGLAMEEKYGPIGEGVIHVHHIVPVSKMGRAYRLDPVLDLVPLCPNCHNIVHKKDPPLTIADLQKIVN